MAIAVNDPVITAAVVTSAVSLVALAVNSWLTGRREQLARQRQEFAKAFEACVAYEEFPYVVRRRRSDMPEEERVRISKELREVQERLAYYSAWLATESTRVSKAYSNLLSKVREIAGGQIRGGWLKPPIMSDDEMNMPDLGLGVSKPMKEAYLLEVSDHLSVFPGTVRRLFRRVNSMGTKGITVRGKLIASEKEEIDEGWVRISEDLRTKKMENRSYVRIRRVDSPKYSVVCQIRGAQGSSNTIRMSEWYREALGWKDLGSEVSMEVELFVEPVGAWGRLKAILSHPNDTLRVGMGLGLTSMGVGLASLALAMVIYAASIIKSEGEMSTWVAALVVSGILVILSLVSLGLGIGATIGSPVKRR